MTNYAKNLAVGDTFYADSGALEVVAQTVRVDNGVWLYAESGESYFYLLYFSVKIG